MVLGSQSIVGAGVGTIVGGTEGPLDEAYQRVVGEVMFPSKGFAVTGGGPCSSEVQTFIRTRVLNATLGLEEAKEDEDLLHEAIDYGCDEDRWSGRDLFYICESTVD